MFLSIVILVYNSAEYLPKCLDSIWSQGLPEDDYEVVCVYDCSTDDSLAVLQQEATSHRQLRVLQNPTNLRAGSACNHGVLEAKSRQLDILMCDSSRESLGSSNNQLVHHFSNMSVMTGRTFMLENSLPFVPWKYVFRRQLMVENNVWLEENVNCEDVDWTHKLAFYAQTMQYQPILLIHYVLMPGSETRSEYKNINTIQNRLFSAHRVSKLKDLYSTPSEHKHIETIALSTYTVGLKSMCASSASPRRNRDIIEANYERGGIARESLFIYAFRYPCFFVDFFHNLSICSVLNAF